jgi:hypothetical protein
VLNDRTLTKYIGMRLNAGGMVVGVRMVTTDVVEFDVLIDGERQTHQIKTN